MKRIRKTTETTPYGGAVVNTKNNSTNNTYSCDYLNNLGIGINVSPTTPNSEETLWIKKGKNLINPSNINIVKSVNVRSVASLSTGVRVSFTTTNYGAYALFPIGQYKDFFGEKLTFSSTVKPNRTRNVGLMLWASTTPDFASITQIKEKTGSATSSGTNIADTYEFNNGTLNDYYVGIGLYANYGSNPVTSTDYTDYTNLQVEANATQTSYEAYVDKGVYVKNDNNVYDKVYNENDVDKNNYTIAEQRIGTYLGKPYYMITLTNYTLASETAGTIAIYDFGIDKNINIIEKNLYVRLVYGDTHYYEAGFGGFTDDYLGSFRFAHNFDDGKIRVARENYRTSYSVTSMELTLKYTKTTD